ncbi:MAG: glycosyl hydrolase family 2 [Rikenellaceae bacterium]|nr:glycosyl hydrolase family 2 [Rikenellaceae bacterium]
MKKLNLLIIAAAVMLFSCQQRKGTVVDETQWYEIETVHKPFTRWWWLGSAVDKENLTYNLELYSAAGMGGVEITPIYGVMGNEENDIDYLTPEWMEVYKHTVAEAEKLGMIVDMNNGTGWPFGGPDVSIEDAATKLIIQKVEVEGGRSVDKKIVPLDRPRDIPARNATIDKVMAYSDNGDILDITANFSDGNLDWIAPAGSNWTVYALFNGKTRQEVKRAAPGGEGWVLDHLAEEPIQKYLKKFDEAFEKSNAPYPRAFFNDSYEVYEANWTYAFLDEFEKRRGYKLENYIPEFQGRGRDEMSQRVISDYRLTLFEMLMDNFITPWKDWAHSHGSLIRNQSHGSPGNLVDIYASVDIPECETFGRTAFDIPGLRMDRGMKTNDSNPMVLKFASSGANITGKTLTSAETFTWLTEHFRTSLSQCKPEIDQLFASGVNHVFFHGTPYSPKDAEWPGWKFYASINMSPTNTIWKDADAFFAYIARCQSFLQHGKSDNDFLLYFPIFDIWNDYHKSGPYMMFVIHGLVDMIPEFNKVVMDILNAGYNIDYISDAFINSLEVKNGELVTSGGAEYKALILPATKLMPEKTLEKLLDLTEKGAKIIFSDRFPEDVPGLSDLEDRRNEMQKTIMRLPEINSFGETTVTKFGKGEVITGNNLPELLATTGVKSESFANQYGGQFIRRSYDKGKIYFFTMLANNTVDGWVNIGTDAKSAIIFDAMSGEKGKAKVRTVNEQTQVYLQLKPGESLLVKTFEKEDIKTDNWEYLTPQNSVVEITNGWSLTFLESQPRIDGIFHIDTLGSWTDLSAENADKNMGTAVYTVEFELPLTDADDWVIDLGDVRESASLKVNGKFVTKLYAVPYSARIGKFLKPGKNTLEIEVTNLPANRIADYDRRGIVWRIFKNTNINMVSNIALTEYPTSPSGLLGDVTLTPMSRTSFQ